ncbi:MAG: PAS domain S-box protein [Coleofasciculus sp. C1-SOL-03]|jgi:PAS domain S-box-containing protein|uniref:PAS domain S-box protein n=1 Tax=Coleofasciculus sp. C1-SOL-03 TaxID=3069522 RepID=UPI0032FD5C1B
MVKQVIICVDDEKTVLSSLKAELKEAIDKKYLIEIAEAGEEALELVEELLEDGYEIPLIISDHIMPGMKGDELLKQVHRLSPKTLKIMLTGQADIEAIGNAIKYAKLYRYIAKPWQSSDLTLTVQEAVNSYLQDKKLAEQNQKLQRLNQELEHSIQLLSSNERKFRAIFNQTFQFTGMLHLDGRVLEVNQTALEFGGVQLADVVGKPFWECYWWTISPLTQIQLQAAISQAVEGQFIRYEVEILGANHCVAKIDFSIKPIFDESGTIDFLIIEGRDISDVYKELELRKQAEAALLKAEQKYRSIFENAQEGIFQTTLDGHYLNANPALAQIYGYDSPEELMTTLSSPQHQLYVDPRRRQEFITQMQHHGGVCDFESRICRKDGQIIWISESARTIYDASGNPLYYQGFVEDITARKQAEAERVKFTNELCQLNQAFSRFVPGQFLQILNKKSVVDIKLGDQVQQEMSVLFADIRDFTSLSERMTPQENFKFINAYLKRMEPLIVEHQGFIDKYIGDAIMALFSGIADDAVKAGIAMLQRLGDYNQCRLRAGYTPIRIGIGINTGSLMLGTVGGQNRMDGTVISDDVNLAARLEGLTKQYGVPLLISGQTLARLHNPTGYNIRFIEQVKVKGKSKAVAVFEVFDGDNLGLKQSKLETLTTFEEGLFLYKKQAFKKAQLRFEEVLRINPQDTVAKIYLQRSLSQRQQKVAFPKGQLQEIPQGDFSAE